MRMKVKKKVVVSQAGFTAGHLKEIARMVYDETIDGKVADFIINNIGKIRNEAYGGEYWVEDILKKERKAHLHFFGKEFDLSAFEAVLRKYGLSAVKRWELYGLEPHYLPLVAMPQQTELPGWEQKPENWYYEQVAAGKILRLQPDGQLKSVKEVKLEGITVLIDIRLKPGFADDKQMFSGDNLCGSIIAKLREEGKIAKYEFGDQTSRFGVSAEEWQEHIRPVLAESWGVKISQVRLETTIEANVIPQLYLHMPRHKDGETNTWIWYEEYFGDASYRLYGGHSGDGGLAGVGYFSVGSLWSGGAFRPLVVLDS